MATVAELRAQAQELMAKAEEQEQADKNKLFDGLMKKLTDAGYSIDDLMSHARPKKIKVAGGVLPAKYRGPNGELWSGIGRNPRWIADAEAAGKNREDFLIK